VFTLLLEVSAMLTNACQKVGFLHNNYPSS
jgi:hypothetical protein